MKRRSFVSIMLSAPLCQIGSVYAQSNELVVGVDTSFMPFEFKQGEKYVGFDVDIWDAVATAQGWKYRLQPLDFPAIIPALQTKNIDAAMCGMVIKPARQKVIDFSSPYYDSGLAIAVQDNNVNITKPEDLTGKTVGALTGSSAISWLKDSVKDVHIQQFPVIDQVYLALVAGRVDAVVHDTPNVQYFANTAGKGQIKIVAHPVTGDKYGFAFPKGSPLVEKFDREFKKMVSDGRYITINKKWFGPEAVGVAS